MRLHDIRPLKHFLYEDLEGAGYELGQGVLDELVAEGSLLLDFISCAVMVGGKGEGKGEGRTDLIFFVPRSQTTPLETNTFAYKGAYICAFGEFGATCLSLSLTGFTSRVRVV